MGADGGIDPTGARQLALFFGTDDLRIKRLPHTVQALKFILPRVITVTGQRIHRAQGMSIVGSELRVNGIRFRQQLASAGQIGDIGIDFTGIDRVVLQTLYLRAFDFAVPVGTFHQSHHQASLGTLCQIDKEINHKRAAFLVGLHHKTDPFPSLQRRLMTQPLQQIEGDL